MAGVVWCSVGYGPVDDDADFLGARCCGDRRCGSAGRARVMRAFFLGKANKRLATYHPSDLFVL